MMVKNIVTGLSSMLKKERVVILSFFKVSFVKGSFTVFSVSFLVYVVSHSFFPVFGLLSA